MNTKTTLVLLVAVLLAGAIWFFAGEENGGNGADIDDAPLDPARRSLIMPKLSTADVVIVRVTRPDSPDLVFERLESRDAFTAPWRMVEPLVAETESEFVRGVVSLFSGLQVRRRFDPAQSELSLADAGLDPPRATFALTTEDDRTIAVEIGGSVALSDDTYVRVAGEDEIAVVGRKFDTEIERDANDYRAKRLIEPLSISDAHRVRILYDGQLFDIVREKGTSDWRLASPVQALAQRQRVERIISRLSLVRVSEFVAEQPEDYAQFGLAEPYLALEVSYDEEREVPPTDPAATQPSEPTYETVTRAAGLSIGAFSDVAETERFVNRTGAAWVGTAPVETLADFIPDLDALRDPRLTRIDPDRISAFELERDGRTIRIERADGTWRGSGELADVDPAAVTRLLDTLEDANAIGFEDDVEDPATLGFDVPRARLRLFTNAAEPEFVLELGRLTPSGLNTYARRAGEESVLVLATEISALLIPRPLSLRSRTITSLRPEYIQRVRVQRPDRTYEATRNESGPGWQMLQPEGVPVDRAAMRELVNDLARLRARDVVAKDEFAPFGLDDPTLIVEFDADVPVDLPPQGPPPPDLDGATQRQSFTLRVAQPEARPFARLNDEPYVYELDPTVWRVLNNELLGRGVFDLASADVRRVMIVAPGGVLEFARAEDGWTFVSDPTVELSTKSVDELVTMLANLQVQSYIAYDEGDLNEHGFDFAPVTVTLTTTANETVTLKLTQVRAGELPRKAAWIEQRRIFLMRPGDIEKLMRGLDAYVRPRVDPNVLSPPPTGG